VSRESCSFRRDQEDTKARPLTPHYIVSVAKVPEEVKLRTLRVGNLGGNIHFIERLLAPPVVSALQP
jgi:hypothetical protein